MKRNIKMNWGTDSQEFEKYMGRKPSKKEMDEWVLILQRGVEFSIDWDEICQCAAETLGDNKEVNKNAK
jgi:hypothetical protein